MVVESNRRSTWTRLLRELRDALLGGRCGETMELEGREPTTDTPPHPLPYLNGSHGKEWLWFEVRTNLVRRYNTTRHQ
jgi:hypothetical protein